LLKPFFAPKPGISYDKEQVARRFDAFRSLGLLPPFELKLFYYPLFWLSSILVWLRLERLWFNTKPSTSFPSFWNPGNFWVTRQLFAAARELWVVEIGGSILKLGGCN
jgi:hypothetical protein